MIPWLRDNIEFLERVHRWGLPDGQDALDVSIACEEIAREATILAHRIGATDLVGKNEPSPGATLATLWRLLRHVEGTSPTLGVRDVARLLGCTERTVWRHEGRGLIPEARRIGGVVRWDRAEFDEWLATQRQ